MAWCIDKFTSMFGKDFVDAHQLSSSYCPNSTGIMIGGSSVSTEYNYFQITISKCTGSSCKSDAEIDNATNLIEANFIVSDYYFDSNDYSTPVKTSYNDRFTFYGVQGISKKIEFRMKRNTVLDQSSPFFFVSSKTYEYFSLNEINQEVQSSSNNGTILDIKIVLDNKNKITLRQVYSLGDMVGQVGGMNSILFTFCSFFVGTISSRTYLNSLISSFYQVKKDKSAKVSPKKLIVEEAKEIPFNCIPKASQISDESGVFSKSNQQLCLSILCLSLLVSCINY